MRNQASGCVVKNAVRGVLFTAALAAAGATAQTYPVKPVRLVVGYPPGGLTDAVGRVLAPRLSEAFNGQQVIVDNRGGGGSTIGTDLVAKALPDGYTLLVADQALINNPSLYPKLPYDTLRDLQPIAVVGAAALVIVEHPSLPVQSMKELAALARSKPGQVNYASGGNGTATHLAGELFKQVAKVDLVHIPYKGAGPGLVDLLGGQVSLMFSSIGPAAPHVASGRLRAIATTGEKRAAALSNVPTIGESGFPAATAVGYWGLLAPAKINPELLERLNKVANDVMNRPEVRQRLVDQGFEVLGGEPARYERILKSEIDKWGQVIRSAGVKVE